MQYTLYKYHFNYRCKEGHSDFLEIKSWEGTFVWSTEHCIFHAASAEECGEQTIWWLLM